METYQDIQRSDGIVNKHRKFGPFENSYGASVIQGGIAYTNSDEWELAVLRCGSLCYDTPITNDVIPHLTWVEKIKLLGD